MSWVKWVLPEAWFRRGFDKQQEQQAAAGHTRQRQADPGQQEVQDVWTEAVTLLQSNGGDVQVCAVRPAGQCQQCCKEGVRAACVQLAAPAAHATTTGCLTKSALAVCPNSLAPSAGPG
jgi:hypothetical protein